MYFDSQGRPLYWQVEANASWKKLRKSKKIENWGNIFFVGKLPRNAWNRIRQLCVVLQQLQFFCSLRSQISCHPILSKMHLKLRRGQRVETSFPGIFKVNVTIFCLQQFQKFFCSLRWQTISTSTLNLFHRPCLSVISAACTEVVQLILRKIIKIVATRYHIKG